MSLPTRISSVTLACRDIGRMAAFYRQFEWPEAPSSVPEHVVFQCTSGVVLGLFSATQYEPQFGEVASEFRGFTLAINCDDATAVFRAHEEVSEFDDVRELDDQPQHSGLRRVLDEFLGFCRPSGSVLPTKEAVAVTKLLRKKEL